MKKILTEAISTKLEQIKGNYSAADGETLAVAMTDGECCMLIIKKKHILDVSILGQMAKPKLPAESNQTG